MPIHACSVQLRIGVALTISSLLVTACRRSGTQEIVGNRGNIVQLSKARDLAGLYAGRIKQSRLDPNSTAYQRARTLYDRAWVENNSFIELLSICIENDCGDKTSTDLVTQAKTATDAERRYFELLGLTQETSPGPVSVSPSDHKVLQDVLGVNENTGVGAFAPAMIATLLNAVPAVTNSASEIFISYRKMSAEERAQAAKKFKADYKWERWEDAK